MENKKIFFKGIYVLGVIITTGMAALYVADESFDHTTGPCPISRLTHNVDHQVKKLEKDDWNVLAEKEANTYMVKPIIHTTSTGEQLYLAPEGGILQGSNVIMPNPNVGFTVLNISKNSVKSNQGYTLKKTIKMGF